MSCQELYKKFKDHIESVRPAEQSITTEVSNVNLDQEYNDFVTNCLSSFSGYDVHEDKKDILNFAEYETELDHLKGNFLNKYYIGTETDDENKKINTRKHTVTSMIDEYKASREELRRLQQIKSGGTANIEDINEARSTRMWIFYFFISVYGVLGIVLLRKFLQQSS